MNVLLVNVPSRKGQGGFMIPLGLLYVARIVESFGGKAKIVDPYLDDKRLEDFEGCLLKLNKVIEKFKPDIIGFGGIATSYPRAKQISLHIKKYYPEVLQIAGGPLASTYELLLTKTYVDVVFHGEVEITLPQFLEDIESYRNIKGISYKKNGHVIRNSPQEQIRNLDAIPLPAYHLVNVSNYFYSIKNRMETYKISLEENPCLQDLLKNIGTKTHYIPIISSRGCTNQCSFCYRHVQGYRKHSVNYVIEHIKFLQKNYGVSGFEFVDELFNTKDDWVLDFCNAIEDKNLDIFYIVGGARVDLIDERILRRLKETGCTEINFGQESGSNKILKEYRKGVSAEENTAKTLLSKRIGLHTPVQLVIGSPSETTSTIRETIEFLKKVDAYRYSPNYLVPLPETPIWEYVMKNRLIPDIEKYLEKVADCGGWRLVNLTKVPNRIWRGWGSLIKKEMTLHYAKRKNRRFWYVYYSFYLKRLFYHIKTLFRNPRELPYYIKRIYSTIANRML